MNPTSAVLRAASVVALAAAVSWLADLSLPTASYYPLDPGLKWTYEVSSPEGGSAMLTVVNGPRQGIGKWKATEQRMEL